MASVPPPIDGDKYGRLVDWLYPPRCRGCAGRILGRDAEFFCPVCWSLVNLVTHPLCTICGRPFLDASGDDHSCGVCLAHPPNFTRARAWVCYPREEAEEHPLRRVVQRFKYGRKISIGKGLGRYLAAHGREVFGDCTVDLILPVPLHVKRLRWRGFNQSALLAQHVGRTLGAPMDPWLLYRRRETPAQTQLSEEERRKNVRAAFALRSPETVNGKHVLLVDDVYTSGATVNECARMLNHAKAKAVYVLTLARAVG